MAVENYQNSRKKTGKQSKLRKHQWETLPHVSETNSCLMSGRLEWVLSVSILPMYRYIMLGITSWVPGVLLGRCIVSKYVSKAYSFGFGIRFIPYNRTTLTVALGVK